MNVMLISVIIIWKFKDGGDVESIYTNEWNYACTFDYKTVF